MNLAVRASLSMVVAVLAGMGSAPASAAEAAFTPIAAAEVRVPHSLQWTQTASGSGRQYEIFVAAPEGPPPDGGYTTIYVLDGNAMFLTTVEAVRAYLRRRDAAAGAQAIVVGIGYPEGVDIGAARTYDLSFQVTEQRNRHPTGGAEAFLAFIQHDLKPRIAGQFPVNPKRDALMGHSFGGLFTLGALTQQPDAFQTYVGMSSSFWFGGHDLSQRIDAFAARRQGQQTPVRVLLTAGEFEERAHPQEWHRNIAAAAKLDGDLARRGQVSRATQAGAVLARLPGAVVDVREIAGEDHGTVIPASIGRAVSFILNGPMVVPPVPSGQQYLDLGPEGRYRLRMQVRALPDLHRIPWLNGLKAALKNDLSKEAVSKLHDERQAYDQQHGSRPHLKNAD